MAMTSGADTNLPMLERVADITPAWLTRILTESSLSNAQVADIELQAIGAGNASDTRRIIIRSRKDRADAPTSLICKFHPAQEEQRLGAAALGTFAREAGSYAMIKERKACRIPQPYLLAYDEGHLNLITEDLSQAARPGDQIAGCDATDAQAVIRQIARLHGSFACPEQSAMPPWLMRMSMMGELFSEVIMTGAALAPERFGDLLSAQQYSTITECANLTAKWYQLPWRHLTITHGDLRVDNVLFQESSPDREAVLIDWQLTGLRNPMYDLAYFTASSLSTEDRREHEQRLLTGYLEEVETNLPGYSEQQAIADYRLTMIASLTMNLLATAVLPRTPAANTLILALLQRGIAAAEDWDALAAIRSATSR